MAVLLVWGGFLIAEKVYEIINEQQEQQRRATAAQIQQRRIRDEEEWQLTPRTLLNEEATTSWTGPQPPQEYICPISLELMCDPVLIETGQTFDRESIHAWFARGRRSCPLTNRPLQSTGVCSNTRLAREIALWKKEAMQCAKHDDIDELIAKAKQHKEMMQRGRFCALHHPGSALHHGGSMMMMAGEGEGSESPRSPRMPSVCAARDMAADLDISLDDLSSDRMLTNLVHLVQVPTVTHMAATVLQYVAEQDACDRLRLVKQGVLEAVGAVLGEGVGENGGSDGSGGSGEGGGSDEAKAAVCGLLTPLCRDTAIKPMILEAGLPQRLLHTLSIALDAMLQVRASEALTALLKTASASTIVHLQPLLTPLMHLATHAQQHGGHTDVRPYAMEVMGYMAMNDEVAAAVVEDGIIIHLMVMLVDSNRKLVEKAAFTMFALAMHARVLPKLRDAGAVQPLVTVVREGHTVAQAYAAGVLMYMAFHAGCRGEIISLGAALPLIALLHSSNRRCQGHAAGALSCLGEDIHVASLVGAKGGMPPLVRMLDSQDTWLAELAADTLCVLCKHNSNNQRRVFDAGGLPALIRLLSDQSVSNFALAASLDIIAMLAPIRAVKETLILSDSFMAMLRRYMQHPEDEIASVANTVAHVLAQNPQPGPLLRIDSIF